MSILYIPNNCSATGHLPFPVWGGVRATTGELRLRNCPPVSKTFSIGNLCGFSLHILIVFNHYRKDSIQNSKGEEEESQKKWSFLTWYHWIKCSSGTKKLWLSTMNTTVFQAFCVEWLTTEYQYSKPVQLGAWLVSAGCSSPLPWLKCTSKEADDRMMFHVQNILSPVRTYIHDMVFEWHRCLFVSVISSNSQLEGYRPPRALAHL